MHFSLLCVGKQAAGKKKLAAILIVCYLYSLWNQEMKLR